MEPEVSTNLPDSLRAQLLRQLADLDQDRREKIEALEQLDARRNAIVAMLDAYGENHAYHESPPEKSGLSSLEMARIVLRNAGRPLSIEDLHKRIQETYGTSAAKTLNFMLWRSSRAGRVFFKTEDGKIGLLELQPLIETVGQAAVA